MTMGFGFCANCGTPRLAADQKFCAVCGSGLAPTAPPAPAPVAPPAPPAPVKVAPAPPAPEVEAAIPAPPAPDASAVEAPAPPPPWASAPVAPPPAPPAWSPPPAPPVYQAPTYQAAPAAPGAPVAAGAGFKLTPKILLIGVVVLAVIAGAIYYMNMSSSSGGLTFNPSTVSCSKPVAFTTTVHLASSVKGTDKVTITLDGKPLQTSAVSEVSDIVHQSDGSWTSTSTTTLDQVQTVCAAGGSAGGINILTPGVHTMQFLDSAGKVVASGSYTVTP